jgi:hypothetical protein
MLLVANSAENLQILINRAKSFFDFVNIKLNPMKCEVFWVNGKSKDQNIIIEGVKKQFVTDSFVKYLEIPLGSRKLCKTKFLETKIQKVLNELDKAEFCRLAINQIVRIIKCYILNKLYFLFANMFIPKGTLAVVDKKVRSVINNFTKGQKLQKSFIYASVKNGGLGLPCMEDEYASYKIHHIANLMATSDGKGILDGYLNYKKKTAQHLDLLGSIDKALEDLKIDWLDWTDFKQKRRSFSWSTNEKTGKPQFRFVDKTTNETIEDNLTNFHSTLINHAKIKYDYDNFSRFNTRGLINCMETGISNFYFKECKARWLMVLQDFI